MKEQWYETHSELVTFARVLLDAGAFDGEEGQAKQMLYFFEKPWKWTDEFVAWVRLRRPLEIRDVDMLREAA